MAVTIDRNSKEYITKNPIRSSIGAVGYGACQGINLTVDIVDLSRDIVKLAKLSLKESLIEAETEALKAEIQGAHDLEKLRRDLEIAKQEAVA